MYFHQPTRARVVTACQQLLAAGVVTALVVPATAVLTLDVVREAPHGAPAAGATLVSATVPTDDVEAVVTEVPLEAPTTKGSEAPTTKGLAGRRAVGAPTTVTSQPEQVDGFGAVGVTWAGGQELGEDAITLKVRTRTGETWSEWTEMEYHDEHAPDPASPDAATARPGTEPLFVGDVDDVQVSVATTEGALPEDLSLALVEPGEAEATEEEDPALEGPDLDGATTDAPQAAGDGAMELAAKKVTKPTIFSRAQWGADEKIRDKSSLSYGTISAGFVHHTVNANNYTEAQVPGIIRSIYAYHVKSRGWSDIGYNFLVDRFGRIWEGRFGGVDRPVIGAHTLGYNQYSFAMSAIGNFETVQPSDAMLKAYGSLFAWKLSLHGVDPASMRQRVGSRTFAAINGHRDAGSTACPGKYLYAKIPTIRTYAKNAGTVTPPPVTTSAPQPKSNLAGSKYPDLIARNASDGRAYVIPTEGLVDMRTRKVASTAGWKEARSAFVSPDLTGDGVVDVVHTDATGRAYVRPGSASGTFGEVAKTITVASRYTQLAAAGDLNGDGRNDLVARRGTQIVSLLANAKRNYVQRAGQDKLPAYTALVGPGDFNGDGKADVLGRTANGQLWLHAGTGTGEFAKARRLAGSWSSYVDLASGGDFTGDGRDDLVGRRTDGRTYVIPATGNGTFGTPQGSVASIKFMRSITGAGNVTGSAAPDLVGVRGNDLVVIVNRGTRDLGTPIATGVSLSKFNLVLNVGDFDRDGHGDFVTRGTAGRLRLYRGRGNGKFTEGATIGTGFTKVTDLRAVGDVTGDGYADLIGVDANGTTTLWAGTKDKVLATGVALSGRQPVTGGLPSDTSAYDVVLGIQDLRLGSVHDYVARERRTGDLYLFNGTSGAVSTGRPLGNLKGYDLVG